MTLQIVHHKTKIKKKIQFIMRLCKLIDTLFIEHRVSTVCPSYPLQLVGNQGFYCSCLLTVSLSHWTSSSDSVVNSEYSIQFQSVSTAGKCSRVEQYSTVGTEWGELHSPSPWEPGHRLGSCHSLLYTHCTHCTLLDQFTVYTQQTEFRV